MADFSVTQLPIILQQKIKLTAFDCWQWDAAKQKDGYGICTFKGKFYLAHRLAYILFKGAIPQHLEIDHICRNRQCINPAHLEAVTHAENVRRGKGNKNTGKTHCKRGHPFTEGNIYYSRGKNRSCRTCVLQRSKFKYYERKNTCHV